MRCPRCGFENPTGMRFCGQCGAGIDGAGAQSEERKVVTVLFADIVASTALSARIDPEQLREQMARFFAIARGEIERNGGTVEKFIGDAVMAVFGLPVIHEEDPKRAVQAAVTIRSRVRPFVDAGIIPEIRIGINTGEVIANPKAVEKGEFLVTGEVVNLAARLQQQAAPGQVLVGESTHAATAQLFEYGAIPPIQVKGKSERVIAFEYLGARRQYTVPDVQITAPMVGRERELDTLLRCLDRLLIGQGGMAAIIGEPGIGKSRLLAEARSRVGEEALCWLMGRSLPYGQSISYWPFLDIFKQAAGITERDDGAASWTKLTSRLAAVLPDQVAEVAPYLGTLLGLDVKEEWRERVRHLDGEPMGRQIYRSSRLFFEHLAHERPLALIFEDLHWIDSSSAGLLDHLIPLVETVPLFICGISRPAAGTPAGRLRAIALRDHPGRYTEISLPPLLPADGDRLIRHLMQIDDLPPHLQELILQKTGGNPFFVEEIIRSLIDTGAITRDAVTGRWHVRVPAEQMVIPDTLRGVIMARIDRLDVESKEVLKAASVIGRSFFYRVLQPITEGIHDLDRQLAKLQKLELISRRHRLSELEFAFKHALTQEAAYETILLRRRREVHGHVAETIERLFADRLEEFFGLLAYHFARAEEWPKAQEYLFKAADQASRVAADAEALTLYRQAALAYERVFGERWDPLQRSTLERKIGEALFRRGEFDEALASFQRALDHLRHPAARGGWSVGRATLSQLVVQLGHLALPWLFLRRSEPDAVVRERARLYEDMGLIHFFTDPNRLLLDVLMLLNVSEPAGYDLGIALGSAGLGTIFNVIPFWALARRYHARSIALAERTKLPSAIALAHLQASFHYLRAGADRTEVLRHSERAEEVRQAGELLLWAAAKVRMAWELRLRGEIATALAYSREIVREGQEAGDPQVQGWGLGELGAGLLQVGDVAAAILHLDQAMAIFRSLPDYLWIIVGSSTLSRCYLRQDRGEEAVALLEDAATMRSNRGFRGWLGLNFYVPLVEAYVFMAERKVGDQEHKSWLARARRTCQEAIRFSRFDSELAPGSSRCRGTLEWLQGRPSVALRWWRRSVEIAEHMEWPYDKALTWMEVGRRTGDRKALELASKTLVGIGARLDSAPMQEPLQTRGRRSSETIR